MLAGARCDESTAKADPLTLHQEVPLHRSLPISIATAALGFLLAACASSGASPGAATSNPDLVTGSELAAVSGGSAYDLVRQLRPRWLQANAPGSLSGMRLQVTLVYLDGNKLGGLEALRSINANGIKSMQWLDAVRAATILTDPGSDPIAGAILIVTASR